jgi:hypothetical protein
VPEFLEVADRLVLRVLLAEAHVAALAGLIDLVAPLGGHRQAEELLEVPVGVLDQLAVDAVPLDAHEPEGPQRLPEHAHELATPGVVPPGVIVEIDEWNLLQAFGHGLFRALLERVRAGFPRTLYTRTRSCAATA